MSKVYYNQPGYVGCSMSVRAKRAYAMGEKPRSRWTKTAMLRELREKADDYALLWDPAIEKMKKEDLWSRFFCYKSWHHTSKYANQTNFYGVNVYGLQSYLAHDLPEETDEEEEEMEDWED